MSHLCDILIVGGGVLGASIAFHLAQRRPGRVMLVEKAYLGAGASGKSSALVYQSHRDPLTTALARRCLPVFEHFADVVGGPPVFWRTGMVRLLPLSGEAELEAQLDRQRELDIDVRRIADHELMEVDPNARLADDEVAAFEPAAGYVEAVQVVALFAEAARREGADIRQGVEVRALLADKGKISGVETNEGTYECARLVLATGAWAAQLPRTVKIELPVQASRAQVALFRRPADSGRRGVVFADFVQGLYLRPDQGELIHAGDLAEPPAEPLVDPDACNEAADADWLPAVRQRLIRRYPAMYCGFGRGGYGRPDARTPDGRPILDRLPELEGAFCAAGFGDANFLLAPLVGQAMAQWLVEDTTGDLDLTPFRLARFAEAEPAPATETAEAVPGVLAANRGGGDASSD
jgi:glycine/D-amino acid oxidase-like deaminating enzyme